MPSYKVTFAHTPQVNTYDTHEAALEAVRTVFTHAAILDDNSEGTLVWSDEDAKERDLDGSRTVARIKTVYAEPLTGEQITDATIRENFANSVSYTHRQYAERALVVIVTTDSPMLASVRRDRAYARARCAEIINARNASKDGAK